MNAVVIPYHTEAVNLARIEELLGLPSKTLKTLWPHECRQWMLSGEFVRHFRRLDAVFLYTPDARIAPDPALAILAASWLGRKIELVDAAGRRKPVAMGRLPGLAASLLRRPLDEWLYGKKTVKRLRRLRDALPGRPEFSSREGAPLYLRPDLTGKLEAGGSVSHMAGVLNGFAGRGTAPIFCGTFIPPGLDPVVRAREVVPPAKMLSLAPKALLMAWNSHFYRTVAPLLPATSFLYQRHGLGVWCGAELALRHGVPLVLEYNGSEIWIERHWGRGGKEARCMDLAEELSLRAASLVVAVSEALAGELESRGIPGKRILVNPNGVDTEKYKPELDGTGVRKLFALENKIVIGFIGTFGKWHGAENLARAFCGLGKRNPELRGRARLLMIGDGPGKNACEEIIRTAGCEREAVFCGLVPQENGPQYLAACDILVSPHVPNADGTPFFGSPTKLFEYMAMGKAIVASALAQLDTILEDGETALKIPPGDVPALTEALEKLCLDSSLRRYLGRNARLKAESDHSWNDHARRIMDKIMC